MKTLIGFLAGLVLAGGIAFFVVKRQSGPATEVAQVQNPVTETASAPPSEVVETPKAAEPEPVIERPQSAPVKQHSTPSKTVAKNDTPAPAAGTPVEQRPAETTVAKNEPPPAPEAPAYQPPPPPPQQPNTVTIPEGTVINVRMQEALSSDKNSTGDAFSAVLDKPLVVQGFVIAERGARVEGRIVAAKEAGRIKGLSNLAVELLSLHTADGQTLRLVTDSWEKSGESGAKGDAAKVGAAAGIGAAIGAIAGGGKGAAIGAVLGGGAGTGGVLATRGKAVKIPVETRIPFRLREPVTLTEKL
ncbi:MAG: hypothetical protein ABI693_11575 [Bryobacteraceae bacterium]